ncbi:hypothetical protein BB558_004310 [Smittium angustum]|uniref:Pre-mRNA-splicing factor CWC24 n=1 Tax=Smittium angustum TaxID=133377 RepID=A0A2U1J3Q9_SMIAN|nr:hypothetical protein BB558_004310 [Smittium angustum]
MDSSKIQETSPTQLNKPQISFKKFKKSANLRTKRSESDSKNTDQNRNNDWEHDSKTQLDQDDSHKQKKTKNNSIIVHSKTTLDERKAILKEQAKVTFNANSQNEQVLGVRAEEIRLNKIIEKTQLPQTTPQSNPTPEQNAERSKQYKGMSSYRTFAPKQFEEEKPLPNSENTSKTKQKSRFGPVRASQSIRITSVIDYQPDVCKDYKETGFCGYGDSCVFLHDRGDYKSGWELEKEWEEQQANGGRRDDSSLWKVESSDNESAPDEELPFECSLCLKEFTKPIMTKCNHYFCESCALKSYLKSPKCSLCGTPTGGMFKPATALIKKLQERKEQEKLDTDQKDL